MTVNNFDITILCRVVDNYGDIGFAWRLARRIHKLRPKLPLRLVTDDLAAFSLLAPGVDKGKAEQTYCGLSVYDWNDAACADAFIKNPPRVIVQCFQCGYPAWLEDILFVKKLPARALVVNVDYLTAEPYAEDFHLLKSLTRTERVQKINFMPGFTKKTGGLIADDFADCRDASFVPSDAERNREVASFVPSGGQSHASFVPSGGKLYASFVPSETRDATDNSHGIVNATSFISNKTCDGANSAHGDANATHDFSALVFAYAGDFSPLVDALAAFEKARRAKPSATDAHNFRLRVYAAAGSAQEQFVKAWKAHEKPFALVRLPFLPQEDWDALLREMSFLFVRGEDSLSRACLSGLPFVWQAYRQKDDYQLTKVDALLERMKPHFSLDDFALLSRVWRAFNTTEQNAAADAKQRGQMRGIETSATSRQRKRGQDDSLELLILELLKKSDALRPAFTSFADSLKKNGDFAEHLLHWLENHEPTFALA